MSLREYFENDLDYFVWKLLNASDSGTYFEHDGNTYVLKRSLIEHNRTYVRNESSFNKWCEEHFSQEELRPGSSTRTTHKIMSRCSELSHEQAETLDFFLSVGGYQKYLVSNMTFLSRFSISCNGEHIAIDFLPLDNYEIFKNQLTEWVKYALTHLTSANK